MQYSSVRPTTVMKTFYFSFVLSSILIYSPAYSQVPTDSLPPGVTSDMVRQGNALFHGRGLCVNCHGEAARGFIGPDLTDSDWLQAKGSYLSILQVVLFGVTEEASTRGTAMPARGGAPLDDTEIQAVAAYVWRISHQDAPLPPGVTPSMVNDGHDIFNGKGTCVTCHGATAQGKIGPNLTDSEWLQAKGSYLEIVNTINSGITQERSTRGVPMPPRGGANLDSEEVHAIGAYVWYISHYNE